VSTRKSLLVFQSQIFVLSKPGLKELGLDAKGHIQLLLHVLRLGEHAW